MKITKGKVVAVIVFAPFLSVLGLVAVLLHSRSEGVELDPGIVAESGSRVLSDAADSRSLCSTITAAELKEKMDDEAADSFVILDIRDEAAYEQEHIPGAISIPMDELGYRLFVLDKTKDIIVYCESGVRCRIACQVLVNAGFKDVQTLVGGIKAWNYAIESSNGSVGI